MTGASWSVSFVSCMSSTSGAARDSHHSTLSMRALSELTFQVAILISPSGGAQGSVAPAALTREVEARRVADCHDRHRARLDGVRNDEVDMVGQRAGHVQRDDRDAGLAELIGRPTDVAAHQRSRQDEAVSTREVGHRPDGGGNVLLPDERDRVDADPLAAQVVAIRLAHRTERDLCDLGAATDHDDALAEDSLQRPGEAMCPNVR